MGGESGLWGGTPARGRSLVSALLLVLVAVGALVPWLRLVDAWILAGDPATYGSPGMEVPRLLIVVDLLQYLPPASHVAVLVAMAAAVGLLVIGARPHAPDLVTENRRGVVALVGVVGVLSALRAVIHAALVVVVFVSTPDEVVEMYAGGRRALRDLQQLMALGAEALAWSVIVILAVGQWGRAEERSDDDDVDVPGSGPVEPREEAPAAPEGPPQSLRTAPVERVDPARLRPDGSSDSGFDEFHFRR